MKVYTVEQYDDPYCCPYIIGIFWLLPDAIKCLKKADSGANPFITEWLSRTNGCFIRDRKTEDGNIWIKQKDNK